MSDENVEIVRKLFEAGDRGDARDVLSLYDPEVELDSSRSALGRLVGGEVYRGHSGVRQFYRAYDEAWEHIDHDIQELIDAGDRVVSIVNIRARGRASAVEVELRMSGVWTIRNGKVARVAYFQNRGEALEAAGLAE